MYFSNMLSVLGQYIQIIFDHFLKKNTETRSFPVETGRKLNVHKTFRRRPGRLLKVLCAFNLRPVSTGFV